MAVRVVRLSKSRFQAGLQCPKRLWLLCHRPEWADPPTAGREAIFAQGHRVGRLARERFPGGMLVAEDHLHGEEALETTQALLADGIRTLYEAAFVHDEVFVRADVLTHEDGGWVLAEVKSSTRVKDEHLWDAAIQVHVLRGAGLPVDGVRLVHVNTAYVYPGGGYDLDQLFIAADITGHVEELLPQVPPRLAEMRAVLADECPPTVVGRRCGSPYDCEFAGFCRAELPAYPVIDLPRYADDLVRRLFAAGVFSLHDVPLGFPGLTPQQRSVCSCVQSGRPLVRPGLAKAMADLRPPLHFLDFETFNPALPLYPDTAPYQVLPMQWSCHSLLGDHAPVHRDFLHTASSDPRRAFAQSLLAALGDEPGAIVAYSSYEGIVLARLVEALPDLAAGLSRLQARVFDLATLVRGFVEHPEFHGGWSLKVVLPALAPDVTYEGLAIQEGGAASSRYAQAISGALGEVEQAQIFADLRAYCAVDTLGLLRVFQELRRLAEEGKAA